MILSFKDNDLDFLKSKIKDLEYSSKIESKVNELSDLMVKTLYSSLSFKDKNDIELFSKQFNLKPNWLKTFAEEVLMKYLTNRTDLHTGNLGITEYGLLRYFDPSFKEPISEIVV